MVTTKKIAIEYAQKEMRKDTQSSQNHRDRVEWWWPGAGRSGEQGVTV